MEIISNTLYFVGLLLSPVLLFWIYSEKVQVEKMELGALMIGHQNKDYLSTKGHL